MQFNIPAVLFAGGQSSRMGQDKALLPFAGYETLSEYQYSRLSKYFKHVYISSKEDKFDFQAEIIFDRYPESSPLVGLASVFETLEADTVFILSVDAPFVNEEVIETLIKHLGDADTVIARTPGGKQPLCGIYRRSILPFVQESIENNQHKIGNVLQKVLTKYVDFKDEALFMNLNHPHEYEAAVQNLKKKEAEK